MEESGATETGNRADISFQQWLPSLRGDFIGHCPDCHPSWVLPGWTRSPSDSLRWVRPGAHDVTPPSFGTERYNSREDCSHAQRISYRNQFGMETWIEWTTCRCVTTNAHSARVGRTRTVGVLR
jgi:hypothetical protein